ncbi:hypothetical protein BGI52_00165 [Burkholderia pseudomallei]|nr:hypothetical protein BGI49_00165 [Burkholderia pseudomallei]APZ11113.1 hypothetical protein BGI52_00165 [Burkholderia pseudomallei]
MRRETRAQRVLPGDDLPDRFVLRPSSFVRSSRADALSASLRACISTAERKPPSYRGIVTPTNTPPP